MSDYENQNPFANPQQGSDKVTGTGADPVGQAAYPGADSTWQQGQDTVYQTGTASNAYSDGAGAWQQGTASQTDPYAFAPYASPYTSGTTLEEPTGIGTFVGMQILNGIPVVGLVMDIVWGASAKTKSRRNYGWAALICRLIGAVIGVILGLLLSALLLRMYGAASSDNSSISDLFSSISELQNSDSMDYVFDFDESDYDDENFISDYEEAEYYDASIPKTAEGALSFDADNGVLNFDINGSAVTSPLLYGSFSGVDMTLVSVVNYDISDGFCIFYHEDANGADIDIMLETEEGKPASGDVVSSVDIYLYNTESTCMGLTCNSGYDEVMAVLTEAGAEVDASFYDAGEAYGTLTASFGYAYELSFYINDGHLLSVTIVQPMG